MQECHIEMSEAQLNGLLEKEGVTPDRKLGVPIMHAETFKRIMLHVRSFLFPENCACYLIRILLGARGWGPGSLHNQGSRVCSNRFVTLRQFRVSIMTAVIILITPCLA